MSIDFGFLHQNFSNVIDVGKVVNLKLSFVDSFLANFLVILVSFQQEYEEALANFFREIKMPARKKPLTLQSLSLRCIGSLFKHTCHSVTQEILDHLAIHESHLSFSHLKALKTTLLSEALSQIQQCFFMDTAHYFHKEILNECLVSNEDNLNLENRYLTASGLFSRLLCQIW